MHGLAEMSNFKDFQPLKERMGGDEAFLKGILRHFGTFQVRGPAALSYATRFAPSPTGLLHKGHAFSALTAFEAARRAGGRFVLRIEDIDFTRCRPEFEAAILEDLAWLGLAWERPVLRQSEHAAGLPGGAGAAHGAAASSTARSRPASRSSRR